MTQHAGLTSDRWARFSLDQQILMVGNELNRGRRLLSGSDTESLCLVYERALRLIDLTIEVQRKATLRRELLRWRDVLSELYVAPEPDPCRHMAAMRCLFQLTPVASRQVALLLG